MLRSHRSVFASCLRAVMSEMQDEQWPSFVDSDEYRAMRKTYESSADDAVLSPASNASSPASATSPAAASSPPAGGARPPPPTAWATSPPASLASPPSSNNSLAVPGAADSKERKRPGSALGSSSGEAADDEFEGELFGGRKKPEVKGSAENSALLKRIAVVRSRG